MANYDVTIKEIAPRYVASVRDILESYNYEGRLWHYMMKETADQNLTPANPCLAFGIFHDAEYKERDVDVEIQIANCNIKLSISSVRISQVTARCGLGEEGAVGDRRGQAGRAGQAA